MVIFINNMGRAVKHHTMFTISSFEVVVVVVVVFTIATHRVNDIGFIVFLSLCIFAFFIFSSYF